jgi:hypothetical protein
MLAFFANILDSKITKLKRSALRLFGKRISAKKCASKMLMKLTPTERFTDLGKLNLLIVV